MPASPRLIGRSLRGRFAEALAGLWLRAHGWRVAGVRRRVAGVELDLIARRGRRLLVVEVKSRLAGPDRIAAEDLVAPGQRRRLLVATEHLARTLDAPARLDLIEIRWLPWPRIRWHRAPWSG